MDLFIFESQPRDHDQIGDQSRGGQNTRTGQADQEYPERVVDPARHPGSPTGPGHIRDDDPGEGTHHEQDTRNDNVADDQVPTPEPV